MGAACVWRRGYVLPGAIEMKRRGCGDAVGERWLAGKLMRELLLRGHSRGMCACGSEESVIHFEQRESGSCAVSVCQNQQLVFGVSVEIGSRVGRDLLP